jgi:tetratricopeptide (TPR) repeat protein
MVMGVATCGRAPAVPRNAAGVPLAARPVPSCSTTTRPMRYHTRMRGSVTSMLLLGAMAVACSSVSVEGPPATLIDLPWSESPADRAALAARGLFERGQQKQALEMLEGVLAEHPRHADACRLRQDILRERGRRGLLWYEAEQALEKDPNDGLYLYLFGRLVSDQDRKTQSFSRAAVVAPQLLWPWLGLAHTWRGSDPAHSLATYERLYAAADSHPLVGIAYAAMLREREQYDAAIPIYQGLQQDARVPGVGDLGLAQSWLAQNDRTKAWGALLAALRQRPFDAGVQGLLVGWLHAGLSDEQVAQVFDVLREDPERMRAFGEGDGALALAELLKRVNQPLAMRSLLEEQKVGPRSPLLRRLQRRVLLGLGEVDAFLELVRADVPEHVVLAEPNQLRNRWLSLLRGPWSSPNGLASADHGVELLERLRDVGWLDEVELASEWALRRWPEAAPRIQALCDEARRELAFEAGVRRLLYRGESATARSRRLSSA